MAKTARKTIEVGTLLHRLNYFLANDKGTADEREIMISFVEGILHDTGNYRGYRYLDTSEIAGNGSRRYYFVSGKIQEDYDAAADLIRKHYPARGV
jgi:hypothetical protein